MDVSAHLPEAVPRKRHWLWPTRLRFIVGFLIVLAIWGWFDVRKRGVADPERPWMHKTDFTVYTEAGAAFFDGRDPYTVTNLRGWGYLYPPLFAILVAPLHALDSSTQVLVWFALSLFFGWGCCRECLHLARMLLPKAREGLCGPIPAWLGAAAFAAAIFPALNCLQRGQVGLAKLYFLLLGFRLLIGSTSVAGAFLAGCVLAIPVVLKVTPAVPVLFALGQLACCAWWSGWKSAAASQSRAATAGLTTGLAMGVLLIPAAFVGWQANLHHLNTWWNAVAMHAENSSADDFAGDSTSVRNQSLDNAARHFGNWMHYALAGGPDDRGPGQIRTGGPGFLMDAAVADHGLFALRALAGGLLLLVAWRTARRNDRLGQTAAFGLACVSTLVIFTIARGHYYVMFLPAITFQGLWLLRQGRPWAAQIASWTPVVLVITHYAFVEFSGRIGLLGLGTFAWYAWCAVSLVIGSSVAASTVAVPPQVLKQSASERSRAA